MGHSKGTGVIKPLPFGGGLGILKPIKDGEVVYIDADTPTVLIIEAANGAGVYGFPRLYAHISFKWGATYP
jgi:hypothetical protein